MTDIYITNDGDFLDVMIDLIESTDEHFDCELGQLKILATLAKLLEFAESLTSKELDTQNYFAEYELGTTMSSVLEYFKMKVFDLDSIATETQHIIADRIDGVLAK